MDKIVVDEYTIFTDRKYLKSHEWVKEQEDGTWLMGISDYAQKMLNEISYVQFEDVDEEFAMKSCALREAVEKDVREGLIPCCVIATLGTTGTTAIDPIKEIGEICDE